MKAALNAYKKLLVLILLFAGCTLSAQWKEYTKEVKSGLKSGGNGIKVLCEDQSGNI